jgi:hypothetical protein
MRKLAIRLGMGVMLLIPIVTSTGRQIGEKSGMTIRYLNAEWLGYGFTIVFGVADMREEYAEYTEELIGE